jgi:hypothetical protein
LHSSRSWSLVDAHLRHEHAAYADVVRSQGPALAATAKAVKAGKHPATALAQYHAGAGGFFSLFIHHSLLVKPPKFSDPVCSLPR